MAEHDFKKTLKNHCVFIKKCANNNFIILLLYVDDMLIIRRDPKKIVALKEALSKSFAMKDLESAKQILGIKKLAEIDPKGYYGCPKGDMLKTC